MRKLLLLLFALASANLFAQDGKTFEFEGKVRLVYPIVLEAEKIVEPFIDSVFADDDHVGYSRKYNIQEKQATDIPPVLQRLIDGDYVMLQNREDVFTVRAVFSVLNGKITGWVVMYDAEGKIEQQGEFINGYKNGKWKEFVKEGDCNLTNEFNYVKGEKSGAYKVYHCVNSKIYLLEDGEKANYSGYAHITRYDTDSAKNVYLRCDYMTRGGDVSDYYKEFYPNGALKAEILKETFDSVRFMQLQRNERDVVDDVSLYDSEELEDLGVNSTKLKLLDTLYFCLNSGSLRFYHANGKVAGDIKFNAFSSFSYNLSNVHYHQLLNDKGGLLATQSSLPDTLGKQRTAYRFYDEDGILYKQVLACGTKEDYSYSEYEVKKRNSLGEMAVVNAYYDFLYDMDKLMLSNDTMVLLRESIHKGTHTKQYVSPALKNARFTQTTHQYMKQYFNVYSYDPNNFLFTNTVEFGDLKAIIYTRKDKSKKASRKKTPSSLFKMWKLSESKLDGRLDSMVIYYQNKPVSAKVYIVYSDENFVVKKEKKQIVLNMKAFYTNDMRKKIQIDTVQTKAFIECEKGEIKLVDYNLVTNIVSLKAYVPFQNSMPHGKMDFEMEVNYPAPMKLNQKFKAEINVNNGIPEGKTIAWEWKKETNSYCLKKVENFKDGLHYDTSYTYKDCAISDRTIYDDNKEKNGLCFHVNYDGDCDYSNYNHGILHGAKYSIKDGDTLEFSNYENGVLQGVAYNSEQINGKKFKSVFNYKDGKMVKTIKCFAEDGSLRMAIEIDSCYGEQSYYGENKNPLQSWEYLYNIAGRVKWYYPNGSLYAEGQTAYALSNFDGDSVITAWMNRTGIWKYYYDNGKVKMELDYNAQLPNTMYYRAAYVEYYPSGRRKYDGYVTNDSYASDCESDFPETDFSLKINNYLKEDGTFIVKNGSGYLKLYHFNGVLKLEGKLVSGKHDGWWKEYNNGGHLISVGKYILGEKDGRWLEGDLEGINYLDDRCFENLEAQETYEKEEKNSIEITEQLYTKGQQKFSKTYSFKRSIK